MTKPTYPLPSLKRSTHHHSKTFKVSSSDTQQDGNAIPSSPSSDTVKGEVVETLIFLQNKGFPRNLLGSNAEGKGALGFCFSHQLLRSALLMVESYRNNYFFAYFEGNFFLISKAHVASSIYFTNLLCTFVYRKVHMSGYRWGEG